MWCCVPAVRQIGHQRRHRAASSGTGGASAEWEAGFNFKPKPSEGRASGLSDNVKSYYLPRFWNQQHNSQTKQTSVVFSGRAHRIRGNKVARRVFAPVFPRLVHVDDKPTLGVFAAGVDQSDRCITLKLLLYWNYTYIWHSEPFLQEACRGPTGKRNTNLETLCLPKWRGILTGLRG